MSDTPVTLPHSVAGFVSAPSASAVLVVDDKRVQARVRELLPDERFEVFGTGDPEEAVRLLHALSPDFAVVSAEVAARPELDLVRRLQTDPRGDVRAVYVLLPEGAAYDAEFLRQTGADGVLVEPLQPLALAQLIESRVQAERVLGALAAPSEGTVEEIATRFADEVRRGITDSLQTGRNETIGLSETTELMAAAWSAVGRVRALLAAQSRGRVRFRDDAAQGVPAVLSLGERATPPDHTLSGRLAHSLAGRRVVVADDDPAVLWFFAGLLREVSAQVFEAQDGQQALELVRRRKPHVVITDILMPKLDGFALCREIKHDVMHAHVPVILLSWKEDFLQRMRELAAGASGYLRKEAGSQQILDAVAQVLRPRVRLEEQLRGAGEARGRVEGLGVLPLIETAQVVLPAARVSVRDAWNLYEVDLHGAGSLCVTRTAADGSFSRGQAALQHLLGVTSGRFTVTAADASARGVATEPVAAALQAAGRALAALLDAVSSTRLLRVARIAFDDEVVSGLVSATPTPLAQVVERLRDGGVTANELLLEGTLSPSDLEEQLRELARRGAIVGVWGLQGEDLVAEAACARDMYPGLAVHSLPPQHMSPLPGPAPAVPEIAVAAPAPQEEQAVAAAEPVPEIVAAPIEPRGEGLRLLLILAALTALGYFGWRSLAP